MVVDISFTELSDYIKCHYKQTLSFSRISAKEVKISYEKKIIVKTISVSVNLVIENVESDAVTIVYSGNFGIEMIIAGVMAFIKAQIPELSNALVSEEGHQIRILLSNLEQTKALVDAISLEDIEITETGIQLSVSLK